MFDLAQRIKPRKPYPSFPLTAHNNGQWCKKIRSKVHFFGVWADPQAALNKYLRVAADLHAGQQPPQATLSREASTVKDVCNYYLSHQLQKAHNEEIRASTFEDCRVTVQRFASLVGSGRDVSSLGPSDFEQYRSRIARWGLGRKRRPLGVHALSRAITIIRGMFKHAYNNDLIDRPMKFGTGFDKPSAALKRRARQTADLDNGKRLFEPSEILCLL
jgi:hypothetical protein